MLKEIEWGGGGGGGGGGWRRVRGRRGNVGRGREAQVGEVSGRSLTIVRGPFRRRSKREGGAEKGERERCLEGVRGRRGIGGMWERGRGAQGRRVGRSLTIMKGERGNLGGEVRGEGGKGEGVIEISYFSPVSQSLSTVLHSHQLRL